MKSIDLDERIIKWKRENQNLPVYGLALSQINFKNSQLPHFVLQKFGLKWNC